MKKFFILFCSLAIGLWSAANSPVSIDEKMIEVFNAMFPNAEQVKWQELNEAYVVSFMEDGIREKAVYRKDGAFARFTRYYEEQSLPLRLREAIKSDYPHKRIFGVTEVTTLSGNPQQSETLYYLKLEDLTTWMTVVFDKDGNSTVVDQFTKSVK